MNSAILKVVGCVVIRFLRSNVSSRTSAIAREVAYYGATCTISQTRRPRLFYQGPASVVGEISPASVRGTRNVRGFPLFESFYGWCKRFGLPGCAPPTGSKMN
jgi:hypothetical protein